MARTRTNHPPDLPHDHTISETCPPGEGALPCSWDGPLDCQATRVTRGHRRPVVSVLVERPCMSRVRPVHRVTVVTRSATRARLAPARCCTGSRRPGVARPHGGTGASPRRHATLPRSALPPCRRVVALGEVDGMPYSAAYPYRRPRRRLPIIPETARPARAIVRVLRTGARLRRQMILPPCNILQ